MLLRPGNSGAPKDPTIPPRAPPPPIVALFCLQGRKDEHINVRVNAAAKVSVHVKEDTSYRVVIRS